MMRVLTHVRRSRTTYRRGQRILFALLISFMKTAARCSVAGLSLGVAVGASPREIKDARVREADGSRRSLPGGTAPRKVPPLPLSRLTFFRSTPAGSSRWSSMAHLAPQQPCERVSRQQGHVIRRLRARPGGMKGEGSDGWRRRTCGRQDLRSARPREKGFADRRSGERKDVPSAGLGRWFLSPPPPLGPAPPRYGSKSVPDPDLLTPFHP